MSFLKRIQNDNEAMFFIHRCLQSVIYKKYINLYRLVALRLVDRRRVFTTSPSAQPHPSIKCWFLLKKHHQHQQKSALEIDFDFKLIQILHWYDLWRRFCSDCNFMAVSVFVKINLIASYGQRESQHQPGFCDAKQASSHCE